jgi:CrcB protein
MTPAERLTPVGFLMPPAASFVTTRNADALRDRIEWRLSVRFIWGFVIVFIGGGFGSALRHGVNITAAHFVGRSFPYGTMFINVTGSLVMGLVAEYFALKTSLPQTWLLFLTTGILGGYTTFSTFSLETALLYERGEIWAAGLYVLGSVVLAIIGLFVGIAIVRAVV